MTESREHRFLVSVSRSELKTIDAARGTTPRATWVRQAALDRAGGAQMAEWRSFYEWPIDDLARALRVGYEWGFVAMPERRLAAMHEEEAARGWRYHLIARPPLRPAEAESRARRFIRVASTDEEIDLDPEAAVVEIDASSMVEGRLALYLRVRFPADLRPGHRGPPVAG